MRGGFLAGFLLFMPVSIQARLCGWLNAASAVSESTAILEGEVLGWYTTSLAGTDASPAYLRIRVIQQIKGEVPLRFAFVNIPCASDQFKKGQRVLAFIRGSAFLFHESVSDAGAIAIVPGYPSGTVPEESVKNALIHSLGEKSVRPTAIQQLASFKSADVREAIDKYSDDENGIVRSRARAQLARDGDIEKMREVVAELLSPSLDIDRGIGSVRGTQEHGFQEQIFTYYGLFSGIGGRCSEANRKEELGHVVERPKFLETDRLAKTVAPLRRHRNRQIREGVSMYLRECRSVESTKLLLDMMDDENEHVSYHAMMGLCMRMKLDGCPATMRYQSNKKEYISLIRSASKGKKIELPRRR